VLDTNIYDQVVIRPGLSERLARLQEASSLVILQPHIVRDELEAIRDEQKRAAVLALPVVAIPTSGAVWDVSKWGQATLDDGVGDVKIDDVRRDANHVRDALIATTAAASADVLVTDDKRLASRVRDAGSSLPVWNFAELFAFVESLELANR
jgi:predicted nucleic acid-binding protein